MTFEEYLMEADAHFRYVRNTGQDDYRKGQAFYNYLRDEDGADRAELTRDVLYTDMDPFNDDNNLGRFLAYVKENW